MPAQHSTQWFWNDWLGDQAVRRLTPAERGVWIDLLAFAAVGSPTGYVCDDRGTPISYEEIARVTNAGSPTEVAKLIEAIVEKGAASRDRTGRLFNRRMVRSAELSAKRKRAGKKGGDHTALRWLGFQSIASTLPQQVPRQLPQHLLQERVSAPTKSKRITSSESVTARASPEGPITARSLATAPLDGALTREPGKEQASTPDGLSMKRPHETTRAELDAMIGRKNVC